MQGLQSKLVLVVDDDPSLRSLLESALRAKGYDVQQAGDGLAAAERLGCSDRLPDLIICDVMMPTIDGFSLVRLMKGRAELRSLPVIFLTARTGVDDVIRGLELGARQYVLKPFNLMRLIDTVDRSLR
jgi:two-component system, OmpR family, response regulator